MKLIVSNFPPQTQKEDIQKMFQVFGDIQNITLLYNIYTKKFRGMAHVVMPDEAQAKRALAELNGTIIDGNTISINLSVKKKL
ncbi:MAG: RNA-binding protein [Desulfobacteraceae bacterium]|nr:RNA-binding protein [Desulfobacteraceae bacterium]